MRHFDLLLKGKYRKALEKNLYFRGLGAEEIDNIIKNYKWNIIFYNKKEMNFDEEIFLKNLNIILDGEMKISKLTESGKEILYDILESGGCFGLAALYTKMKMDGLQCEALEKTCVFSINSFEFKKLIFENPIFFKRFMEFQEYRLHFFVRRFENSFVLCPKEKLLYYFDFLKKWDINEVSMKKVQLANYLNIGRASLYRELDKMKREKLIDIIDNKIYIK